MGRYVSTSRPGAEFESPGTCVPYYRLATEIRERQNRYAERLRAILENPDVRSEFSDFLVRSLAVDLETVTAILWEPPRALLTEAVPTLLRRLENWLDTNFWTHLRVPCPAPTAA